MEAILHKTGYAMKEGKLVHISEVPRGLRCNCQCVACGQDLIARKGPKRCHHFAHTTDTNCNGGAETALHLIAKEIFGEIDNIVLPEYVFCKERKLKSGVVVEHKNVVVRGGNVEVTGATIEPMLDGFKPDVILNCISKGETKVLIVEIAVTHFVDCQKERRIRNTNLPAVEIRLDFGDALLSREELRNKLVNDLGSKDWLFHPNQRKEEKAFADKLREARRQARLKNTEKENIVERRTNSMNSNEYIDVRERVGEKFNRAHGRYPTMDECLKLWPHLYKKK